MRKNILLFSIILSVIFLLYYSQKALSVADKASLNAAKLRLEQAAGEKLVFPLPDAKIIVYKELRKLELCSGNKVVKNYKVGLGGNPVGHKEVQGDLKTPEGNYRICLRHEKSEFHLFLALNYPNGEDAKNAFLKKIIDKKTYNTIVAAETQKKIPPWYTKLGGEIGVHGSGSDSDWTLGCIALDNPDIEELWVGTKYWTPVIINK